MVSKMKEFMSNVCTAFWTIEEEHETLKKKYQTLQKRCELESSEIKKKYQTLQKRCDLECSERRRVHNALIELKGNIRVFCRCTPLNHDEKAGGSTSVVDFESCLENELKIIGAEQFKFDHIFRPEDNQETPENRGVNYRILEELFRVSKERSETMRYELSVSLLEVYNEVIRDLFVEDAKLPDNKLKVKLSTEGTHEVSGLSEDKRNGTCNIELSCMPFQYKQFITTAYSDSSVGNLEKNQSDEKCLVLKVKLSTEGTHEVSGLSEVRVHNTDELWNLLKSGSHARSVGSTNANEYSSRSHRLALGSSSFPDDAEEQPLELERQLVAKEASLPQEPTFDDVNAVNPNQKVSKMKEFMSSVCTALRTIEEEHETLKKKYQMLQKRCELECSERRDDHNALIELKGNIRVFCRCRPLNHDEKAGGSTSVVDFESCLENG
nr:kinesin-like protein KIN-14S [Tanacetum cinerariifolium]